MAITSAKKSGKKRLNAVRFVSKIDDAIDHDSCDYQDYLDDPASNLDKLVMKSGMEPTYFILNVELSGKEAAKIKDAQMSGLDEDKRPVISTGKWAYQATKTVLKLIENPKGAKDPIELKKTGDGYVDDRTMSELEELGIVDEIWQAYMIITGEKKKVKENAKN